MDIVREVEKVLAIQEPQKKLDVVLISLAQIFEKGQALQFAPVKLGKAVSLLLVAAMEEQHAELREGLLSASLSAISSHQISKYIDWIMLVEHLPRFSGTCLKSVLRMLGYSERYAFLVILQDYLAAPDLLIQIEALTAMQRIWWDVSGGDQALKKFMQSSALAELSTLLSDPQKWSARSRSSYEQLAHVCEEIALSLRDWLRWRTSDTWLDSPSELREQFARMRAERPQKSWWNARLDNYRFRPPRELERKFERMCAQTVAYQKVWFRTHKHYEF